MSISQRTTCHFRQKIASKGFRISCHKPLQVIAVTALTVEKADCGYKLYFRKSRNFHPVPPAALSPRQWWKMDAMTTFVSTTLLQTPELLTTRPVLGGHVSEAKPGRHVPSRPQGAQRLQAPARDLWAVKRAHDQKSKSM